MTTMNPFDLLGDDAEDPSQLIAAQQEQLKVVAATASKKAPNQPQSQNKPAQLPTKPLPPAQAVREVRNETSRGGARGGGRGYGRGRGGSDFNRDSSNYDNSFSAPAGQVSLEEGDTANGNSSERRGYGGPYRGGPRRGFSSGELGEEGRPRREFERRIGTGRGNEFKREGAGRGNWGTPTNEIAQVTEEVVNATEKNLGDGKPANDEDVADGNKESPTKEEEEEEEKEPEDKEMTLEEYEKVLEEKRKAFQALKTEGRKVDIKEFESMQQLSSKRDNDDIFVKLGSDKDKRKDALEKEEKSKKSFSINEFLKPAEGERYYNPGGRGRGRGRGSRGGYGGYATRNVPAPSIEDPGQFPTLGAK